MSNDLISRRSIIEKLENALLNGDLTIGEQGLLSDIVSFVAIETTAYDIDKIVEELEERKEEREKQYKRANMEDGSYMLSKCFSEGARAYGNAIEIVKAGVKNE